MIKEKILENLQLVLKKLNINDIDIALEKPANSDFGDYSTSIALKLTKQLKKNPLLIAEEIKKIVDVATDPWGADVSPIKIQDIEL